MSNSIPEHMEEITEIKHVEHEGMTLKVPVKQVVRRVNRHPTLLWLCPQCVVPMATRETNEPPAGPMVCDCCDGTVPATDGAWLKRDTYQTDAHRRPYVPASEA